MKKEDYYFWLDLIKGQKLDLEFLNDYRDELCKDIRISNEVLINNYMYPDLGDWIWDNLEISNKFQNILIESPLSIELIEFIEHKLKGKYINWNNISFNSTLTFEILDHWKDKFNWKIVFKNAKHLDWTTERLEKYKDYLHKDEQKSYKELELESELFKYSNYTLNYSTKGQIDLYTKDGLTYSIPTDYEE